jgi:hypothetical protein
MVRNAQGTGVEFKGTARTHDPARFVPLECTKGSCVVLHGSYVHMSKENTSDISRHAYSLHFIEGDGAEYPRDNWYDFLFIFSFFLSFFRSFFFFFFFFSLSSPSPFLSTYLFLIFPCRLQRPASDPFHSI